MSEDYSQTCKNCRWSSEDSTVSPYLNCYLEPPTVHVINSCIENLRPSVLAFDFCSKFAYKNGKSPE